MDTGPILDITREGMSVGLMVSMPILVVVLFLGLIVSVFQAVTQVQEMTLTYVPKLIGVAILITFLGGWMLQVLVNYTRLCFESISRVGV